MKIRIGDVNYPKQLLNLSDPPKSLQIRGEIGNVNWEECIAIVGSREVSAYGRQAAEYFASGLARAGYCVISGFMYGVDTIAHKAALSVNGRTIAVLGNGLNHIYPKENDKLYTQIIQSGGAIISEYDDNFGPKKWTFPQRNRLVAALACAGTLVIEAGEMSGSLITAQYADELGRPLFAVPGPFRSKTSVGTNLLIKSGAAELVLSISDIIPSIREK